ncbi:hypothetical protein Y1Q_0003462 [Alligator mississippiensis]|uniref:Uncharacterized protein n=1 Tax=Alligator mississippiensis TaxID=8496 RepID=A0A151M4D2_ALLMI|nr:hypothetical protein Y1Q_0003462 [Alligator mississippiensis]
MRSFPETATVGSWSWLSRDVVKIFVVAAVLFLTYGLMKAAELYKKRQKLLKVLKNFSGPPTHWLYGHLKLEKWEQQATPKMSMEIFHSISLMTLDTILKCAFSYESNCQMDSGSSYIRSILDISTSIYQRFHTPLHHNATLYWLSVQGRHFCKACTLAHDHTDKVIRERKEALKDEQVLSKILKKRCLDFLDILLCAKDENGNGLSDEDLRAEVDTFMFAGHDTTASGISWLFYCLALHPEHQQRCREEIQEILGDQETIQWNCIGQQFAMNELKVTLALTLLRFELSADLSKPPIHMPLLILRSKNGIHLYLKKIR